MTQRHPLFETIDLTVRYDGVLANDEVSLAIEANEIVGLIGPNGAGKTSLVDAVTGFTRSSGRVRLDGADVAGAAPHRLARMGLVRTWQSTELFNDLTVVENVMTTPRMTVRSVVSDLVHPRRHRDTAAAERALTSVGLEASALRSPEELSLGEQRLLGLARALAGSPRVVLLDEPAAGLATHETEALGRRLEAIAGGGVSLLLIDHDVDLVLRVCNRIYVLDFGRIIARGGSDVVRNDPNVIDAYLGVHRRDHA